MVEWKKLGEVCVSLRKEIIKQGDLKDDGKYPVVNSGITLYGYYDDYNNEANAFTVASRGEYAGFITYMNDNFWAGGLCYPYRSKNESICLTKYMYSYLKNKERYIMDTLVMRGGIPALNKADVDKILIPIPSLSEQQRIVSILDTFTSSISNLKQQIEERRKQYEYERDLLLDLEGKEGVEMKKLGDCVLLITDGDHQPPPKSSEGIPFVTISDIEKLSHTIDFSNTFFVPQEYYNSLKTDKKAKKGDVLYTVTGSFGIPVLIEDNREFCFQRHIALIRPNNTIALSRYIYHWLCSNYAKKQEKKRPLVGHKKQFL